MSLWTEEEQKTIAERLLALFKTTWTLEQQRAFIEKLWINHAYFHGLEGKSVMPPLWCSSGVSEAWAHGKADRERGEKSR